MKKCPMCSRTFTDDALSFCLDDGSSLLSVAGESGPPAYDPGATMQYNPGSGPASGPGSGPASGPGSGWNPQPPPQVTPSQPPGFQAQPPAWSPTPPAGGMQGGPPKKKSKGIYWVIGIVAALLVFGVGGIILVLVLIGVSDSNTNNGNSNNSNTTSNRNANNSNSNNSNENSNSNSSKSYVVQDDFSVTKWWVGSNLYGKAEYINGEYQLSATGGYVAVYAPNTTYDTKNTTTRVTARSVTGVSPDKGFGLTVHSEMKSGQLSDYAFVIRTGDNKAFSVSLHKDGAETQLVDWTSAPQIRAGSATNQLEVRATESEISFYINGQYATRITDATGNKGGISGFYASGNTPIAFDDLEIFR